MTFKICNKRTTRYQSLSINKYNLLFLLNQRKHSFLVEIVIYFHFVDDSNSPLEYRNKGKHQIQNFMKPDFILRFFKKNMS